MVMYHFTDPKLRSKAEKWETALPPLPVEGVPIPLPMHLDFYLAMEAEKVIGRQEQDKPYKRRCKTSKELRKP
jgi:hypothetical protein